MKQYIFCYKKVYWMKLLFKQIDKTCSIWYVGMMKINPILEEFKNIVISGGSSKEPVSQSSLNFILYKTFYHLLHYIFLVVLHLSETDRNILIRVFLIKFSLFLKIA